MAEYTCVRCQTGITDKHLACPGCGARLTWYGGDGRIGPPAPDFHAGEVAPDVANQTRTFFMIDKLVVSRYGPCIGPYGLALYAALVYHMNTETRLCWPSYHTLAKETGMSTRQAIRAAQALQSVGLIVISHRAGDAAGQPNTSNQFAVRYLPWELAGAGAGVPAPPRS